MNRDQQIEFIRSKCIEANPDKQPYEVCPNPDCGAMQDRSTRLADVLLAINPYTPRRHINAAAVEVLTHWRFESDNLTEQSDECITFLAELLK